MNSRPLRDRKARARSDYIIFKLKKIIKLKKLNFFFQFNLIFKTKKFNYFNSILI